MHFPARKHTRVLTVSEYRNEFDRLLSLLTETGIGEAEIMFGWAWGKEYRNRKPVSVALEHIGKEIGLAEEATGGKFGEDDIYLIIPPAELELIFCHEGDIHINYRNESALSQTILAAWYEKEWLTRQDSRT